MEVNEFYSCRLVAVRAALKVLLYTDVCHGFSNFDSVLSLKLPMFFTFARH
jgi:hypothetical protein